MKRHDPPPGWTTYTMQLPVELHTKLKKFSHKKDLSIAHILREAAKRYLKEAAK